MSNDRVIAIEIPAVTRTVEVGDTLRVVARPLNAAGQVVSNATVTWAVLDTGVARVVQVSDNGLVTGLAQGTGHVQARADDIRSDSIAIKVEPRPGTAVAMPGSRTFKTVRSR